MDKPVGLKGYIIAVTVGLVVLIATIVAIEWFDPSGDKGEIQATTFEELADVPFQVVDNSYFSDESLESWYMENRQEAGEYVYPSDEGTYILLSIGLVEDDNTFLLLNGAKEDENGNLVVGYDRIHVENTPEIEFEDDIRSTLVLVEGNYDDVKAVTVEES